MEGSVATEIILPISMGIIMLGMGLSLTLEDFRNVVRFPKAALLGLCNQLIVLPAIAFTLATLTNMPAEMAIGLMIIAACPGGATSNLITHIAKGEIALSITLTAISSTITVFTIPLIISFALVHFGNNSGLEVELPILKTVTQIMGITILPVSLGMVIRRVKRKFAYQMERPVRIASLVIFLMVAIGIIIAEKDNIAPYFRAAGLSVILLNLVTMLIGYLTAKSLRLKLNQVITITIESGVQNAVLAMVIAASILKQPDMAIPAAVYSLVMLFSGGFMMWRFGRRSALHTKP